MLPDTLLSLIQSYWIFLLVLAVLLLLVLLLRKQGDISHLHSNPHPVADYSQAARCIEALRAAEPPGMNPDCRLQWLTHGKKVPKVIVLVHGYTNNSRQFVKLGRRFYSRGYNVLIANLPYHGLADRMNTDHGRLTAEQMVTYADETVDIACGLGEQVTMLGISLGGVITAWAAQTRADLDLGVVISPAFGARALAPSLTSAAMKIILLLPDKFIWWDPRLKEKVPPAYGYPRFSLHSLAQAMRLGFAVRHLARRSPIRARRVVVVFNPSDLAVNDKLTRKVIDLWKAHNVEASTYEFDAGLELEHDLIDPNQPGQKIDIVYPRLIDLVEHPVSHS